MTKENDLNDQVEEVIDGGKVDSVDDQLEEFDGGYITGEEHKSVDEIRSKTARQLAFTLVYLFAGALALHYAVFLALALTGKEESADMLSDFLNVWLPALTGIVSAAAAYYFSKER